MRATFRGKPSSPSIVRPYALTSLLKYRRAFLFFQLLLLLIGSIPKTVQGQVPLSVTALNSSVNLEKSVSPLNVPETGGSVTYTISISNTSSIGTLLVESLLDDKFGNLASVCLPSVVGQTLAPGASTSCTFKIILVGAVGAPHSNKATVVVLDEGKQTLTASDEAMVEFTLTTLETPIPTPTEPNCTDQDISEAQVVLDSNSAKHHNLLLRLTRAIQKRSRLPKDRRFVKESLTTSKKLYLSTWNDIWEIPSVITQCGAATGCRSIDNSATTQALTSASSNHLSLTLSLAKRLTKLGGRRNAKKLSSLANNLHDENVQLLATIPDTRSECR